MDNKSNNPHIKFFKMKRKRKTKQPLISVVDGKIVFHQNITIEKDGTIKPKDKRFKSAKIDF